MDQYSTRNSIGIEIHLVVAVTQLNGKRAYLPQSAPRRARRPPSR